MYEKCNKGKHFEIISIGMNGNVDLKQVIYYNASVPYVGNLQLKELLDA